MIEATDITKSFGRRKLWSGLSFKVDAGEMIALVGPSGSGKSTLLSCLGTLDEVDGGIISVGGKELRALRAGARRRLRRDVLGFLFQNYALIDKASINFNLGVAVGSVRERRETFDQALREVGLGGRGEEMIYRLSGGEQQRVALARLIVKKPRIVLADEPTGALDSDNADTVIRLLRKMADDGCSVIVATHSKYVETNCDSTITMTANSVVHDRPRT